MVTHCHINSTDEFIGHFETGDTFAIHFPTWQAMEASTFKFNGATCELVLEPRVWRTIIQESCTIKWTPHLSKFLEN